MQDVLHVHPLCPTSAMIAQRFKFLHYSFSQPSNSSKAKYKQKQTVPVAYMVGSLQILYLRAVSNTEISAYASQRKSYLRAPRQMEKIKKLKTFSKDTGIPSLISY